MKVAIIGAGNMASAHLKVLDGMPDVEVVGVTSRTISKAKMLAETFKIPAVFNNIRELYNQTRADGVIIAVNELSTETVCLEAIQYPWTLLVEKPIGLDLATALRIKQKVKENNRDLFVGMNRRHYSSVQSAKHFIDKIDGERVIKIVDQEDPSSALEQGREKKVCDRWHFANSIHLIDLFNFFCRGKLESVDNIVPWQFGTSFFSHSVLRFDSGDTGIYHSIWNAPGPWSLDILTRSHYLELRPIENLEIQTYPSRIKEIINKCDDDDLFKPGLKRQMKEFCFAINKEQHSLVSIDTYIASVKLTDCLYNSYTGSPGSIIN